MGESLICGHAIESPTVVFEGHLSFKTLPVVIFACSPTVFVSFVKCGRDDKVVSSFHCCVWQSSCCWAVSSLSYVVLWSTASNPKTRLRQFVPRQQFFLGCTVVPDCEAVLFPWDAKNAHYSSRKKPPRRRCLNTSVDEICRVTVKWCTFESCSFQTQSVVSCFKHSSGTVVFDGYQLLVWTVWTGGFFPPDPCRPDITAI